MSYHINAIPRGVYGKASKVKEEMLEWADALEQGVFVMELVELSDLLGAIEAYIKPHDLTLDDLIAMKNVTKRAFDSGHRESRNA